MKLRPVREKLFHSSNQRADHGGDTDTKATTERLAQLRAQRSKLLGYPTYAAFVLDDESGVWRNRDASDD